MAILYVMIGIPGSGKSTYAKSIPDAVVLGSDNVRYELTGSYSDMSCNRLIFRVLEERIFNLLKEGKNVVYDATNISYWKREHIFKNFKSLPDIKIKFIFMDTSLKTCLERNEQKGERKAPDRVLAEMYLDLDRPNTIEDFDELIIVTEDGVEKIYESKKWWF